MTGDVGRAGRRWRGVVITVAMTAACGDGTGPPSPPPPPTAITFSGVIQPLFTQNCAFASGCHAGSQPQQGMNLSAGQAYAHIVSVPSMEVPRLMRIDPQNPDSSYLVLKLEGKAGLVGGVGTRMPLGGQLTQAQIDTVRAWVAGGAQNN